MKPVRLVRKFFNHFLFFFGKFVILYGYSSLYGYYRDQSNVQRLRLPLLKMMVKLSDADCPEAEGVRRFEIKNARFWVAVERHLRQTEMRHF